MIPLLSLLACGGPPAGIPDTPGTIDADVLPNLVTIGSPDLPWLLWLTLEQLAQEDWRDCPSVYLQTDGASIVADGCVDSSGIEWFGSASLTRDGSRTNVSLREFGADDTVGGWTADGTVAIEVTDAGTGFVVDVEAAVVSLANGESKLMWADTSSAYTTYEGVWYADRHDGAVGLQDWGVADITTRNTPLALLYDCGWASHVAGSEAWSGTNTAFVDYHAGGVAVSMPLPPADTGADTGDTGAPVDTGDTGEGGETGDTDTDTDTDIPDFDDDADADAVCGTLDGEGVPDVCRDASIDGASLDECVELSRTLSWPFPPPF